MYTANLEAFTGRKYHVYSNFRTVFKKVRSAARAAASKLSSSACVDIKNEKGQTVASVCISYGALVLLYNEYAVVERWL